MSHKLVTREIQTDPTIRLRFEGGAWATMSFQHFPENDWWQVSINSDWGNWSYSWSRSGMGKDIFTFMTKGSDKSYFISKFTSSEEDYFNPNKSAAKVRKEIRETLTYWDDKEHFEYLINLTKELEQYDNMDLFMNKLWDEKDLKEFHGDEPWHFLVLEMHPRTKYFFKHIFPKFFPEIKKLAKINK